MHTQSSKLRRWSLLATTLAASVFLLQGCGGGSDGGTTTAASSSSSSSSSSSGGSTASTFPAIPAAGSAAAIAAAAAAPGEAVVANVAVNSPPVITFDVRGSDGKHVSGLTLVSANAAAQAATTSSAASAAALAADANCSGNNLTFGMAKLIEPAAGSTVPSVWQSLISRQRYFGASINTTTNQNAGTTLNKLIAPKYRFGVVEATTDPKPTLATNITKVDGTVQTSSATNVYKFVNPATAVSDPSTRIVGILEEDAAAGTYTYRFATDVVNPLKMADAADVKNVTPGKLANDGNVAVKDGKTIHRITIQTCFTDPVTKLKTGHPMVVDFKINADGSTTPVTSNGSLALAKQVVSSTTCQECHSTNPGHGGRGKTDFCVTCHNPGTIDFNTNNVLDMKLMVHGLHMGKELAANYQVNGVVAKFTDTANKAGLGAGIVYGFGFPQDPRNCTKCHDNTKAAQADNWKNIPSRNACGGCHNGINFDTGKGLTLADAAAGLTVSQFGHVGQAQLDDKNCALCHNAASIPDYHKTTIASTHNPVVKTGVATFEFKISKVTLDSSRFANVDFQILKNGSAVTLNANTATQMITGFTSRPGYNATSNPLGGLGPNFNLIYATAQDGIAKPSDWNSGHDAVYLHDLWLAGPTGNTVGSLTLKDAATSTYTAVIKSSSNSIRGTSVTLGHQMALPADAGFVTALLKDSFTQDGVTDLAGVVPAKPAMASVSGQERRVIVDLAKCEVCHDRLGSAPYFHTGGYSTAICAACHTPNQGGSTGWSASARIHVHGIHAASKRTVPFTWHAVSAGSNYSQIGYPGTLKNCETCHLPGTYDFSSSIYTSTVTDNFLYVQSATGTPSPTSATNLFTLPQAVTTRDPTFLASKTGKLTTAFGSTDSKGNQSFKADGVTSFGTGWSINGATGVLVTKTTQDTNLVTSPIAAVCTSCHDSQAAISHVTTTGNGSFYRPRAAAILDKEQCLFCHGPNGTTPIKDYHGGASTMPTKTITTWSPGWY